MSLLHVKRLGVLPYDLSCKLQEYLVDLKSSQNWSFHLLLLLQHPPTYSAGRRIKGSLTSERARLEPLGARYFESSRGGQVTFHGPGQLIGYPILNLTQSKMTPREYIYFLESTLIQSLSEFPFPSTPQRTSNTGVWVGDYKLGALGVSIRRHITSHGFSLNCNPDLSWYNHIIPCGLQDKKVGSITSLLNRVVTVEDMIPKILKAWNQEWNQFHNLKNGVKSLTPLRLLHDLNPEEAIRIDGLIQQFLNTHSEGGIG